jgi:hypothetical protein
MAVSSTVVEEAFVGEKSDIVNIAKLLIIEEVDKGLAQALFLKINFVYNYFEKEERVFIEDTYDSGLNGRPLSMIPRYVTIDFTRHVQGSEYDVLAEDNPLYEFISKPVLSTADALKMIYEANAKREDRISPNNYFNIKFQDKTTTTGFYDAINSEVHDTYYDISTNEEINNEIATSMWDVLQGNEESLVTSFIQDTDFYQPIAFAFYYGFAATAHSGTFNKLDNLRFNSRINTKYASKIISKIAADGSSPFSDEMKILKEAWDYIKEEPIADAIGDFVHHVAWDDDIDTKTVVLGYVIEKYENKMTLGLDFNRNNLIKHPSIYVPVSKLGTIIDRNVRYGGSYEYIIKTVVGVITQELVNMGVTTYRAALLKTFVSAGTSKRSVYCSERIAPDPPVNLFFQYNFKQDALHINWDFPFNKQQDIKRFQIYRRASLDAPFSLIREYNFDDSLDTDGFSPSSGNDNNIRKLDSPRCYYYDSDFNEESSYIYAVAAIDARGLTSGYSDQFLVRYDRFINKTYSTFISREGAPKPYPNIFLDYDALPDVIKEEKVKKLKIYFNPESRIILTSVPDPDDPDKLVIKKEYLIRDDQVVNNSVGEYTLQIINIDTQEQESIKIEIKKEEFMSHAEQLAYENRSYSSGV